MKKIGLKISGMHCEGCSSRLTKILNNLDGVSDAKVSLENKKADLEYDEEQISIENIKEAISDAGFEAVEE